MQTKVWQRGPNLILSLSFRTSRRSAEWKRSRSVLTKLHRMLTAILTGPSVTRRDKVCYSKTTNNSQKTTSPSSRKFTSSTRRWTQLQDRKAWWATTTIIFLPLWSRIICKIWVLSSTSMIMSANTSRTFVPSGTTLVSTSLLIRTDSPSSNP